jgi:hypothetical protein
MISKLLVSLFGKKPIDPGLPSQRNSLKTLVAAVRGQAEFLGCKEKNNEQK